MDEAADLAGCSHGTVAAAARNGEVTQRKLSRGQPSLDRGSVLAWAEQRRERLEQREQQRRQRQQQQELGGRPDLEHVWLNQNEAAELLGVSKTWVRKLAREHRLPCTEVDGRRWFEASNLRRVLAAREFERLNR